MLPGEHVASFVAAYYQATSAEVVRHWASKPKTLTVNRDLSWVSFAHCFSFLVVMCFTVNFVLVPGGILRRHTVGTVICATLDDKLRVTSVLPSTVLLCGTPHQLKCVWTRQAGAAEPIRWGR